MFHYAYLIIIINNEVSGLNKQIETLVLKVAKLTRQTHELGIPVMILFEGIPASGKTRLCNELLLTLDGKYSSFIATKSPSEEDLRYQFFQKYWNGLPKKGDINVYFRSWYAHYIDFKENRIKEDFYKDYQTLREQIHQFESMLIADNHEIIKFYIEIDEEKRLEHIREMRQNPLTKWKAQEYEDVIESKIYEANMKAFVDESQDWEVIDYTNREHATLLMYEHMIQRLEAAISRHERKCTERNGHFTEGFSDDAFEMMTDKVKKDAYDQQIDALQSRLTELQFALYERKIPLIIVYEGMDAAGKGGNIKRLRQKLDPTGYEVNAIGAPTEDELNRHYLWRFAKDMPKSGHIELFDRSWYGRVLVERVEGFATVDEWQRAYDEINAFEKMWTDEHAIILKFFLTIDKDEQLKRFNDRVENVDKNWKITDEDWRNRDKWAEYQEASLDMIHKTHTSYAPWHVIATNHKKTARIKVLKHVIRTCEAELFGVMHD